MFETDLEIREILKSSKGNNTGQKWESLEYNWENSDPGKLYVMDINSNQKIL